jgi:hypothetical protein
MSDDITQGGAEPSLASAGSATFTVDDVALLYDEWKRRYCGPRDMVILVRRPMWKRVLSARGCGGRTSDWLANTRAFFKPRGWQRSLSGRSSRFASSGRT